MRFSEVLITLGSIASVSAIDAHLHWLGSCTTNALICTNLNPTVCCRSGRESDRFLAIGFRAIPSDWSIVGEGHFAWDCVGSAQLQGGPPDICIGGGLGSYGGARYYFPNMKARNDVVDPTCIPVRPDALGLANGTQYDLTDLSGAAFDQLRRLAKVIGLRLLVRPDGTKPLLKATYSGHGLDKVSPSADERIFRDPRWSSLVKPFSTLIPVKIRSCKDPKSVIPAGFRQEGDDQHYGFEGGLFALTLRDLVGMRKRGVPPGERPRFTGSSPPQSFIPTHVKADTECALTMPPNISPPVQLSTPPASVTMEQPRQLRGHELETYIGAILVNVVFQPDRYGYGR
ncbi:hypothetical protein DL765_007628 [Monosporascus sp. GIB2]|nr:hypothetical protein DL765_007628 [Monosporascus sp. GIB2]